MPGTRSVAFLVCVAKLDATKKEKVLMATARNAVVEPLAPQALTSIDDHPIARPLAETHRQLRTEQTRLTAELVEVRKTILAAERDAPDPLVPSRVLRQARQRAEQLQEELDDARVAVFASTEALEAARSEAKAELRPALKQEAAQILQNVLTQAERLLEAQQDLMALDAKTRRLGISLTLGGCVDSCLPGRIKGIRQALARLQD
jgi:DNA repair exonuclease SbcCD ATPase subunit